MSGATCWQCDDEITRDRFGNWWHTHGHPGNGHRAAPTLAEARR